MDLRKLALRLLSEYEANGKYVNLSLNSHLADGLSPEDRARLTVLLYTTVERKLTLDYLIGALAGRSPADLRPHTKDLLRIGLAQVLYMDSIPDYAAVNETVKLALDSGERSFVNGVLRRAVREKDALPFPPREKNVARYLSIFYSVPLPLVRMFLSDLGEEECESLLRAVNEKPPLTVAVNLTRSTRDELLRKFALAGISAEPTANSHFGIRVLSDKPVAHLPGFSEGLFYVQDEASQIEACALDPEAGERVIDVCAAPGGKSFAAATLMNNEGEVFAFDIHESKLSLITSGASRLGLSSVRAGVRDATDPDPALFGTADRVICDVPCSGLGVLAKKPDIRYKDVTAFDDLPPLALSILDASAKYVKAGGVLLYSTCTLRREENRAVVDAFLSEHGEFSLIPFTVGEKCAADGTLTLYPHRDKTDGFYIAKLMRKGQS